MNEIIGLKSEPCEKSWFVFLNKTDQCYFFTLMMCCHSGWPCIPDQEHIALYSTSSFLLSIDGIGVYLSLWVWFLCAGQSLWTGVPQCDRAHPQWQQCHSAAGPWPFLGCLRRWVTVNAAPFVCHWDSAQPSHSLSTSPGFGWSPRPSRPRVYTLCLQGLSC